MIDWQERFARELHAQDDPESHTERDAVTFHPSQLAKCKRQLARSKFGLEDHDTATLGTFKTGTLIHEWAEAAFANTLGGVHHEHPVEYTVPAKHVQTIQHTGLEGIAITGHADVYDEYDNAVYDFKTRSGWYKFNPPVERHVDQLTVYMGALGAENGQVVYVSKKDMEVRTWPEDGLFTFDPSRFERLVNKAGSVAAWVDTNGAPEDESDLPWDKCDCWVCSQEAASP